MRTRRSALHALGIAVAAAVAGCSDGSDPAAAGDDDGGPPEADDTSATTGPDGASGDDGGERSADDETDAPDDEDDGGSDSDDPSDDERRARDGVYREPVRIDAPSYPIERPDEGEWDELYRCANAPEGPSVPFEQEHGWLQLADGLGVEPNDDAEQYYVAVIDDESDLDRLDTAGRTADFVEATDLSESVLVAVESGWVSSSVSHHLGRVEPTEYGLHVRGCYTVPRERRDDVVTRSTLLRVDRPDNLDRTKVSLVVADDRRVHFNSTEGVVTIAG